MGLYILDEVKNLVKPIHEMAAQTVFTRHCCTGRLLWRVLDMGILSVRLSRPGTDSRPGDRDSGSSPYDSLESLVSKEVIWCHWALGEEIPLERGHQRGVPHTPLEIVILPLLAHLA